MRKFLLNLIVLLAQAYGMVAVGIGLFMICEPVCWIYSGVMAFTCGHLLYRDIESEEVKK